MGLHIISAVLAGTFSFFMGLFVYLKNRKSRLNIAFFIFNIGACVWNFADLFITLSPTDEIALFWDRVAYVGVMFIPLIFAWLIFEFIEISHKYKRLYKYTLILIFLLLLSNLTPFFLESVTRDPFHEKIGPAYYVFILYTLGFVGYSIITLFKYYKRESLSKIKKLQLTYVFIGMLIAMFAIIAYFLWLTIPGFPVLHYFIEMLYVTTFAYAIIKHRLMSFDLAWRYALTYLLYIIIISGLFVGLVYLYKDNILVVSILVFVAIIFTSYSYPWIKYLKPIILGKKYEYWQELDKLAKKEDSLYNSQSEIYSLIKNIEKIMNLRNISLFMFKKETKKFCLLKHVEEYKVNDEELTEITFGLEDPLAALLNSEKRVIFKEDLIARNEDKILEKINKLNAYVIFPLFIDDELTGILFLGPKIDNSPFHGEDINRLYSVIKIVERNLIADLVYKEKVSKVQDKYQRNLMEASKRMIELKNVNDLTNHLMHFIMRSVNASKVDIYLHNIDKKAYVKEQVNDDNKEGISNSEENISEDNCLIEFLTERQDPITYTELNQWANDTKIKYLQSVKQEVEKLRVSIIVPIIFDTLLGFVAIGDKRDGTNYEENDWNTLNLLIYSAAMTIQNILFAENVSKDSLTNLYNHGCFQARLNECIANSIRRNQDLTCIILDIDHFKKYNDVYGHQQGDEILKKFSRYLENNARPTDVVCRYGGEEFAAILPSTDLEGARIFSERVREGLKKENVLEAIKISVGVASFKPDENERKKHYRHDIDKIREKLIESADKALYKAKKEGRDRVYLNKQILSSLEFADTSEKRLKILMTADSKEKLEIHKHYFQLKGYEILISKEKKQTEKIINQSKPDIILVDVDTSIKDGDTIIKDIAQISQAPIGALTEHGDHKSELLTLGAKRVFIKPVEPEEIADWIKSL